MGCWNVEPWDRQVLLLTLETQSRTRHAATDGQHGTDDRPDMEVAQIQSLSQGGDQDLEPGWWRDASEKAGPVLPNCSCMGTGPREGAELLIGVETRKLRRRARYIGRDKVREPQSRVSEVHGRAHDQHRKGRWDSRAGCFAEHKRRANRTSTVDLRTKPWAPLRARHLHPPRMGSKLKGAMVWTEPPQARPRWRRRAS